MEKLTSAFVFAFPAVSYRIGQDLPIKHHHDQSTQHISRMRRKTLTNDNFWRAIK